MMTQVSLLKSFDVTDSYRLLDLPEEAVKRVEDSFATTTDGRKRRRSLYLKEPLIPQFQDLGVFICDDDCSYALRRVEFSNSIFVVVKNCLQVGEDKLATPPSTAIFEERLKRQFEGQESRSRTEVVRHVLEKSFLTLKELEEDKCSPTQHFEEGPYRFPELLSKVPLASKELKRCLTQLNAVVFHKNVRLLHPSLVSFTCNALIAQIDAVEPEAPPSERLVNSLRISVDDLYRNFGAEFPGVAFDVAVRSIGSVSVVEGGKGVVDLDASKILIKLAERILTTLEGTDHFDGSGSGSVTSRSDATLDSFLEKITARLPLFVRRAYPDEASLVKGLRGHVVVGRMGSGAASKVQLQWCPHFSLPHSIGGRVKLLFDILRQTKGGTVTGSDLRWEKEDLRAYVEPLLEPGVSIDAALSKICREHRKSGEPSTYSLVT